MGKKEGKRLGCQRCKDESKGNEKKKLQKKGAINKKKQAT